MPSTMRTRQHKRFLMYFLCSFGREIFVRKDTKIAEKLQNSILFAALFHRKLFLQKQTNPEFCPIKSFEK
jgi:hypothetical protein